MTDHDQGVTLEALIRASRNMPSAVVERSTEYPEPEMEPSACARTIGLGLLAASTALCAFLWWIITK